MHSPHMKRTTKGQSQKVSLGSQGDHRNGFTITGIYSYPPPQSLRKEAEEGWQQEEEATLPTSYPHLQTTLQARQAGRCQGNHHRDWGCLQERGTTIRFNSGIMAKKGELLIYPCAYGRQKEAGER